jgi:hypothetical protein
MDTASRNKAIAIALVAVIAAAAVGWWAYGEHQKRELRKAIVALVADSGARLRAALDTTAREPDGGRKLEEAAVAAERNLAALKGMNAAREQALADAADDYLLTTREILKRLVNVHRYRELMSESLQALVEHMRAGNRDAQWIALAVKARERVNKDYRDLSLAASALDQLLQSLARSQNRIAPYVGPAALLDGGEINAARARTRETAKQAAAEIEQTRKLEAFR